MSENLIFDREEVWAELVERARAQAVTSAEAYHELVDDYFNERLEVGEFDDDQNIAELAAEYKDRWPDVQIELGIA